MTVYKNSCKYKLCTENFPWNSNDTEKWWNHVWAISVPAKKKKSNLMPTAKSRFESQIHSGI